MKDHNFVAIDVETANADMASICQIGLVVYKNGMPSQEWSTYIDPEDYFDYINVTIHGIDEDAVEGAPTFPEALDTLYSFLNNNIVVSHTHFDRVSLHQAANKYSIDAPVSRWLDSAKVARRTWSECAWRGYGLYNICGLIGYEFKHHDALEDAKACAHILLTACDKTNLDINGWLTRVKQPIDLASSSPGGAVKREGSPEGAFYGEVIVFTGALEIPRGEAANIAANMGLRVERVVTKRTTMLVVGIQDIKKLEGNTKSSKHRKAEQLIENGNTIRILTEKDFKELSRILDE